MVAFAIAVFILALLLLPSEMLVRVFTRLFGVVVMGAFLIIIYLGVVSTGAG